VSSILPRPRPRDRGLVLGSFEPANANAITDVDGVLVGHVTLDADDGVCVRTGVTAVLPHDGNLLGRPVPAAVHVINGFGKAIGTTQVDELGIIETPIVLTNTFSVGAAYTGVVRHALRQNGSEESVRTLNPLVLECNDGWLNEIAAMRVEAEHVLAAIDAASNEPPAEGAVGAGRGMMCFGWKGGIGTASRRVGEFVVGALVLANFGSRRDLVVDGVPVGQLLAAERQDAEPQRVGGSCIVVLAVDAPLDARQLRRLAARAQYGLGRTGAFGHHSSGDYAVAFSTSRERPDEDGVWLDPLFQAAVEATEEAVISALYAADTVSGVAGHVGYGLPVDEVTALVAQHGRA
jgi:D-aminopeptidase